MLYIFAWLRGPLLVSSLTCLQPLLSLTLVLCFTLLGFCQLPLKFFDSISFCSSLRIFAARHRRFPQLFRFVLTEVLALKLRP